MIMSKSSILLLSLALAALLWLLNYIAIIFSLYWTTLWYDILMHFLGGLTIGVFAAYVLRLGNIGRGFFWAVFCLAMLIGIGWEIFEYVYDLQGDKIDTAWDLVMDSLGVIVAYLITSRSREFS